MTGFCCHRTPVLRIAFAMVCVFRAMIGTDSTRRWAGRHISEVRNPQLVWPIRFEDPVHLVVRARQWRVRVHGDNPFAPNHHPPCETSICDRRLSCRARHASGTRQINTPEPPFMNYPCLAQPNPFSHLDVLLLFGFLTSDGKCRARSATAGRTDFSEHADLTQVARLFSAEDLPKHEQPRMDNSCVPKGPKLVVCPKRRLGGPLTHK